MSAGTFNQFLPSLRVEEPIQDSLKPIDIDDCFLIGSTQPEEAGVGGSNDRPSRSAIARRIASGTGVDFAFV